MAQYIKTFEDILNYQKYIEEELTLNNSLLYLALKEGFEKWLKVIPYNRRKVYRLHFQILCYEEETGLKTKKITIDEFGNVCGRPYKLTYPIPTRYIKHERDRKPRTTTTSNKKKRGKTGKSNTK